MADRRRSLSGRSQLKIISRFVNFHRGLRRFRAIAQICARGDKKGRETPNAGATDVLAIFARPRTRERGASPVTRVYTTSEVSSFLLVRGDDEDGRKVRASNYANRRRGTKHTVRAFTLEWSLPTRVRRPCWCARFLRSRTWRIFLWGQESVLHQFFHSGLRCSKVIIHLV